MDQVEVEDERYNRPVSGLISYLLILALIMQIPRNLVFFMARRAVCKVIFYIFPGTTTPPLTIKELLPLEVMGLGPPAFFSAIRLYVIYQNRGTTDPVIQAGIIQDGHRRHIITFSEKHN
jgi:hypothetical protein